MSNQILFRQFGQRVVQPVLALFPFRDGPVGLNLVLGTAAQETGLQYLAQYPVGPALGPHQIEPATHDDLLDNFVAFRPELKHVLDSLAAPGVPRDTQLIWNLAYSTAICRLILYRSPEPLPLRADPALLGAYWKAHYNTAGGAGTVDEFVSNFARYIGDPLT